MAGTRAARPQRLFALAAGVPRCLVFNALRQSALLGEEDLAAYGLGGEHDLRWKLLAEGTEDGGGRSRQTQRS